MEAFNKANVAPKKRNLFGNDNMGKEGAINNIDNMELKYAQSNVSFLFFNSSFILFYGFNSSSLMFSVVALILEISSTWIRVNQW